jgi:flagellar hook assembly protein FlgD
VPFELAATGRVIIRIYDSRGRLVRLLADGRFEQGPGAVEWDGRDDRGRLLESGVYLCHLQVGRESTSRKVVLIR